jgi:membrane associated rhomboid family serine protease
LKKPSNIGTNLRLALAAVCLPWLVYLLDRFVPLDLRLYGLRPHQIDGLWGIVFGPFLHGNLNHLIANTGVLFALLLVSLSFSRRLTAVAVAVIILMGGGLVWVFGKPDAIHIGSSGIIFGLLGFLMFIGIFRREKKALIVSIAIFILYGSAMLSLFDPLPGISWAGHFFGFLTGVLVASWTSKLRTYR